MHSHSDIVTAVFTACEFSGRFGATPSATEARREHFFRTILTCPMLSLLLSSQAKVSLQRTALRNHAPSQSTSSGGGQPGHGYDSAHYGGSASASAFEAGHWLEGNIFHLGPSRVVAGVSSRGSTWSMR